MGTGHNSGQGVAGRAEACIRHVACCVAGCGTQSDDFDIPDLIQWSSSQNFVQSPAPRQRPLCLHRVCRPVAARGPFEPLCIAWRRTGRRFSGVRTRCSPRIVALLTAPSPVRTRLEGAQPPQERYHRRPVRWCLPWRRPHIQRTCLRLLIACQSGVGQCAMEISDPDRTWHLDTRPYGRSERRLSLEIDL